MINCVSLIPLTLLKCATINMSILMYKYGITITSIFLPQLLRENTPKNIENCILKTSLGACNRYICVFYFVV